MRYLTIFILILTALVSKAQRIDINYTKTIDPFRWTISYIEFKSDITNISVKVQNTTNTLRSLSFIQKERLYIDKYPYGIESVDNSYHVGQITKNITLKNREEISFILAFRCPQLISENKFGLRIANYFEIKNIPIPELTLADINKQMMTWDQYYNEYRQANLTYSTIEEVKKAIRADVEIWQKKGEFESTSAWQRRVNDMTRQQYISELTSKYSSKFENEMNVMKNEQLKLAEDYEKYKQNRLNTYYQFKSQRAKDIFLDAGFELKPYDADNETFLIHSNSYGDILLPVPVDEAPFFKQNWNNICRNIKPEYVPNGTEVALNKIIFRNNGKDYIYDSHTVAKYAITDVNYNFAPVEIAEINFNDMEIDGIKAIPKNVSSSVVGLNNQGDVLAQTKITPERKSVSASEKSDVDVSIPHNSKLKNSTTFAIIIANEKYDNVSAVPYAENDGAIFSKYLKNTLGLPDEHITVYNNATFGNIAGALRKIEEYSNAFGDKLNIILYYAGHGVPDEKTKQCMILPTDGDPVIPETCYDVDKLYANLGKLHANSIVVLMDACFSGSLRGDGMLFAARSVKIKSAHAEPQGNMVILSASNGDETAFPFEKEQHGLFTYYLLKCLQENKGDVTLGSLSDYLVEQVKRQSVVSNGKIQTPMVRYSPEIENYWRSWKLVR